MSTTAPRKIIIDTDPGIDDAMAIVYALASPELDVIGLTTVFGNAHVETCTNNALRILEIAGRPDIPVAQGAGRPLASVYRGPAAHVHGVNGLADVPLPDATGSALALDAAHFIIEQVLAAPGEITLVPVGPLTNIALAMLLRPDLPQHLAGMVIMGGAAFVPGNSSPAAEANIMNDPEAADIVFGADCPIVMCGLDVTEATIMSSAQIDSLGASDTARARMAAAILPYYRDFHVSHGGPDGIHVHDSTCISYLLAPQHYKAVQHPVRVDTGSSVSRGKTLAATRRLRPDSPWLGRRDVTILTEVDSAAVVALELERLTVG
ncbi:MAG TPA: nucleoside hydrolase [Ilumatobacteraceae bacterium]|nr:nucleoside hydrolase [Ilumatobacteraceae bacterium]